VLWVADRIAEHAPDLPLWFAVDHPLLSQCLERAGYRVVMTDPAHASGTDRIAEANRRVRAGIVVNVQADEPLVTTGQIRALARLARGDCPMATLCAPFKRAADFRNPNQVKVVMSASGRALYFSRSPVPYGRGESGDPGDAWVASNPCYRHMGLYAYKADFLETFVGLPPGRLEQVEKLEQLRALENGFPIGIEVAQDFSAGIDTPEDAAEFEKHLG
jgi:3-deoxy-manno-octulosonate cytidylyltransferase (CMP-KDO synthetase)